MEGKLQIPEFLTEEEHKDRYCRTFIFDSKADSYGGWRSGVYHPASGLVFALENRGKGKAYYLEAIDEWYKRVNAPKGAYTYVTTYVTTIPQASRPLVLGGKLISLHQLVQTLSQFGNFPIEEDCFEVFEKRNKLVPHLQAVSKLWIRVLRHINGQAEAELNRTARYQPQ